MYACSPDNTGPCHHIQLHHSLLRLVAPSGPPTALDYLDEYLSEKAISASKTTIARTRSALTTILRGLGDPTPQDVVVPSVKAYRRDRVADGVSIRTVNKEVGCLRVMLKTMVEDGVIAENPLSKLGDLKASPQDKRVRRRALTAGEAQILLSKSDALDRRSPRGTFPQTPLWLTFLETGARWSELQQLTWAYTDLDQGVLTFAKTKSGRSRSVPIRAALCRVLSALRSQQRQLLAGSPDGSPVFLTRRGKPWGDNRRNALRALRALCTEAGIPVKNSRGESIDIHALRHTAATAMARADLPIGVTQAILGHSDPALTTGVYTHRHIEDLRRSLVRVGLHEDTGKPHGDPALDGARYRIRTDDPSFTKAVLIETDGGSFDVAAVVEALRQGTPVLLSPIHRGLTT
jgi:integrase